MVKIKCSKCGHVSESFDGESTKDMRYLECSKCGRYMENPLFEENNEVDYVN